MERVRGSITAGRVHTDKSLGQERAKVDSTSDVTSPAVQRALDDAIERGRMLADERLWKFRDRADALLADSRLASPVGAAPSHANGERADEGTKAERKATDALVDGERHRADAATEAGRREHESDRRGMETSRQETNNQLSMERYDTDAAAVSAFRREQGRSGPRLWRPVAAG